MVGLSSAISLHLTDLFVRMLFPAEQFDCSHLKGLESKVKPFIPRDWELCFSYSFILFLPHQSNDGCERKSVNERFECAISMKFEIKDIRLKSTLDGGTKERML